MDFADFKNAFLDIFIFESDGRDVKALYRMGPEKDDGYIEYKRCLGTRPLSKFEKYASQMKWRTHQNPKSCATYYIGVEDDGMILGLTNDELYEAMKNFIYIKELVGGSIVYVNVIKISDTKYVLKIVVKIKKNKLIDTDLQIY